ncbi:MinD/ParA family protein [Natronospirillum operosum]|uniref:MinD/ParA family protein n=1 Tax=Natronospirillum operosum TaxID=2759953 RepID=A0A4Z0WG04_9GAMM|nr:MinD/ParA family protein [Natronospirillum operosum]TGG95960.1 MinD/ParA family protein [Natronospirillum operosum]
MAKLEPVQVVAVTGGKGGVGKSNVAINTAVALAQKGKRVVVLDGDLGLANIDVLLGIRAQHDMSDVLEGRCELKDILVEGPGGIRIIPASSGTPHMANLGEQEHAGIIHAFSQLENDLDVLIVDTAAGISKTVVSFVRACQEALVVVCDEPTSITDAYALIKVINQDSHLGRFRIVANMVRSDKEGERLFQKLASVTERFLDVTLLYSVAIPYDDHVRRAVRRQKSVMELYPGSKAAGAYNQLADQMMRWPLPTAPRGHLEFFVERLIAGGMR